MVCLGEYSTCIEKNVCSAVAGGLFYKCQLSSFDGIFFSVYGFAGLPSTNSIGY